MAGSLRFHFGVGRAAVMRARAWFACATNHAALRAGASSDNHADIHCVILMWYVEATGRHHVDVGVHRQVLREHVLFLDYNLLVVQLDGGSLQGCLLGQDGRLCGPAVLDSASMAAGDA